MLISGTNRTVNKTNLLKNICDYISTYLLLKFKKNVIQILAFFSIIDSRIDIIISSLN